MELTRRQKMETVTLSPTFEIVIPKSVRDALKLNAGAQLQVVCCGDRLEFIPIRSIKTMRGFLRGMDTSIEREDDRI
jgi:AbrB family looped-hinge helix DNA binding protein